MSREEEHEVATAFAATGDRRLAERLVNANLRLVVKIVLEYRVDARTLMDLIQEGNVGLMHAVEKFDARRGIKLGTYASWWIRAYVLKFIMSNARLVKVGTTQDQRRLFFGLRKARARLEKTGGSRVDAKALALAMGVPEGAVVEMEQRLASSEASLDAPIGDESGTFGESFGADPQLQPDTQCEEWDLRNVMKAHVATFAADLRGRELEVFHGRMVMDTPLTLKTIADKFGVSRERVRQIVDRLKRNLRKHLRERMGDSLPVSAAN
jgi:RNA polymerase sigma-32 factor